MRLFVCSFLNTDNQAFYRQQMDLLVGPSGGLLRHIPMESAHITHAFIREAEDLEEILKAVTTVAARHEPIAIGLEPPSILYARADARLICASITDGGEALSRLSSDLVGELGRHLPGVAMTGSRSLHVTLARFRKQTHRRQVREIADALMRTADAGSREDRVTAVQVVSSELTATGPIYIVKASAPLRGDAISPRNGDNH